MAHPFVHWATEQTTVGKCDINLYSNFQIITWNINGIRSMQNTDNLKSLKELLDGLGADVICLQETKVTRDMLDENTAFVEGYNSYFAFSRTKAGYSGVVTYCKDSATPVSAEEGLTGFFVPTGATDNVGNYNNKMNVEFSQVELKYLDYEGRAVMTEHKIWVPDEHLTTGITNPQSLIIINVYCPRVDPEKPERKEYKLKFCRLLELRAKALIAAGSRVVIVGDLNISHQAIDTCEDVSKNPEFNTSPSRQWLNHLLYAHPKYNLYAHTEATSLREESRNTSFPDAQGAIDDTTESRQYNHNVSFCEDGSTSETEFHLPSPGNDESLKNRKSYVSVTKCRRNSCCVTEKLSTELDNIPVMIDSFRHHNKNKQNAFTCWNTKSNARATNYGTRIDYILTCARAIPLVIDCHILSEVEGSDHCPVKAFLKGRFHPHFKCPSLCSRYFPEFAGKQVKITSMFRKCTTDEVFSSNKEIVPSDSDSKSANINSKPLSKADLKRKQLKLDNFFPCPVSVKPKLGVTTCEPTQEPKKTNNNTTTSAAAGLWKELLKGPKPAPLCKGHREPCVERSVTKKGPNFNRKFWVCARGVGRRDDSSASCTHFAWK